ncbi:MAG: FAD-dependent oxidoreductase, partial [Pseudomonadota bacterium]
VDIASFRGSLKAVHGTRNGATSAIGNALFDPLGMMFGAVHHGLADEFGKDNTGLHACGMIEWVSQSHELYASELEQRFDSLNAAGYGVSLLTAAELKEALPYAAIDENAIGLMAGRDAWIDVPKLLEFLVDQINLMGGRVFTRTTALKLIADESGQACGLVTSHGDFHSDIVVTCAGQNTPEVLADITGYDAYRTRFPMNRSAGILLQTPPLQDYAQLDRIVYTGGPQGLHARPTAAGGIIAGDDVIDGWVCDDPCQSNIDRASEELLRRIKRYYPNVPESLNYSECRSDLGIRAVPSDDRTLVGYLPGADSVFTVCTHSGITLCLVLADLVCQSLQDGHLVRRLLPYSLERFTD